MLKGNHKKDQVLTNWDCTLLDKMTWKHKTARCYLPSHTGKRYDKQFKWQSVDWNFESKDKDVHLILSSLTIHLGSHILEGSIDLTLSIY